MFASTHMKIDCGHIKALGKDGVRNWRYIPSHAAALAGARRQVGK
jgi:hypothetical protein